MSNHSLVWAAVPHNSDGVVFQVRIFHRLQRFYVSRRVLEEVFELERKATDARQLEVFYARLDDILSHAREKRPIAGPDTVALELADFPMDSKAARRSDSHTAVRRTH